MQSRRMLLWSTALGVAFAVGFLTNGYLIFAGLWPHSADADSRSAAGHMHMGTAYVCPMHPQIVSDKPGTCPICGMALVPMKHPEQEGAENAGRSLVRVAPEILASLGVKTMRVRRVTLVRHIETPGFVQRIEPLQRVRVQAPFEGRVIELKVAPGGWVEQGAPLLTLQSDALESAEQTHVALLQGGGPVETAQETSPPAGASAVNLDQSRQRLAQLGLDDDAIRGLEQQRTPSSRLTLYAPFPGIVTSLPVAVGDAVTSGAELLQLGDAARASVLANAFQRDAAWIQAGQAVVVRLPHVSAERWKGLVNRAAVTIDPNSQNIGVRLSFNAPAHLLKNAMYVTARIQGDTQPDVLAVPGEALIRTESEDRAIVARGQGRFEPVPVQSGIETDGMIEIRQGLKEGDEIVVSAQFLIDSEANLQASYRRMTADRTYESALP